MGNKQGKDKKGSSGSIIPKGRDYAQLQVLAKGSKFSIKDVRMLHAKFKALAAESPDPDQIHHNQWKQIATEAGIAGVDIYLEQLWNAFDDNQSNTIGFREFILGLSAICRGTAKQKLDLSFEVYDNENNGVISKEEMTRLLISMDDHALSYVDSSKGQKGETKTKTSERHQAIAGFVSEIFEKYDVSRTGTLNISEYTQAVLQHPALLMYRADSTVVSPLDNKAAPEIGDGSDDEIGIAASCPNCEANLASEAAMVALINDMKNLISEQHRKINELEWKVSNDPEVERLRKENEDLKAAPIQGGRPAYIAYGVKKGYIAHDQRTGRIVTL